MENFTKSTCLDNGMEHKSILPSISSSSSYSSSLTHDTHTSSAPTVSKCTSSTAIKEIAATPALLSPESTTVDSAQPINLLDRRTLSEGLGAAESPMSKACLSSMIPERREGYGCMQEDIAEYLMNQNPSEHKSTNQGDNVTDISFMGIVSAINAMNGSINASRLSNINLASALETYAAVIHSRTTPSSSAIEAGRNEARTNCFRHAAVFWMEWATVQANLQLSLMQDLFKLKSLSGTTMECGYDSKAEIFDVDSLRATVVKLTKLSHNSFKEAYEKGANWSSVGGLDYWISQLPEPVAQGTPTIITTPDHPSTPPRSVTNTADLIAATEAMKIEQVSLRKRLNDEDLRLSNKLSDANLKHQSRDETMRMTNAPSPFKHLSNGLTTKGDPISSNVDGIGKAPRHNNGRTVYSFRYRQRKDKESDKGGDIDFVSIMPHYAPGESVQNRKQHLTRSHQTMNLDRYCFLSAINDHNSQVEIYNEIEKVLAEYIPEGVDNSAGYGKALGKDTYHKKRTTRNCGKKEKKSMEEASESTNCRSPENSKSICNGGGGGLQEFLHNGIVLGGGDTRVTRHLAQGTGNIYNQDDATLHGLVEKQFTDKVTGFNGNIIRNYVDITNQDGDISISNDGEPKKTVIQDISQNGHGYDNDITPIKANDSEQDTTDWVPFNNETACSFYLSRPLPYAITEEDSCNKTPPHKKGLCQLGVEFRCTTPPNGGERSLEISTPSNIRRKGKFEKKNGAIQMMFSCSHETPHTEDKGVKGKLTTATGGSDEDFTCGLQHEILPLDEGDTPNANSNPLDHALTPCEITHVRCDSAKPLEPNLNSPDQYPSRGCFSEDLQRQPAEGTIGKVENPSQDKQRTHFRWSSHLKKMVAYVPCGDEQSSPPNGMKSPKPMSPTPTAPSSRVSGRRMGGLSCL